MWKQFGSPAGDVCPREDGGLCSALAAGRGEGGHGEGRSGDRFCRPRGVRLLWVTR